MDKKSAKKREYILTKAKQVFIRKGFASVTMKDIIEECGISRGGIYLYFSSVDEIFMQVILTHNKQKLKDAQDRIQENKSFRQVIDDYFNKQKTRFLNMEGSLLMAMHEYRFSHKSKEDKEFYYNQMLNTQTIILELLKYGVKQGDIDGSNIENLAMNIMFFIEGIGIVAITSVLSEDIINSQMEYIKNVIFAHKRGLLYEHKHE